jgi:hypothetical protein
MFFVLIPITDDDFLRSLIQNAKGGKIEWSLTDLYVEKLSKGTRASVVEEKRSKLCHLLIILLHNMKKTLK